MQYFGGKQRIAKELVEFLSKYQENYDIFFEPFVGGCNIVPEMKGKKFASDKNEYLIEMYIALQNGWIPPKTVSAEEYGCIKNNKDENKALTGFVGFGCSYSGKWFGGYARNKRGDNYCLAAYNSIVKIIPKIKDIRFKCLDYKFAKPNKNLIYCDPPYKGTTQYGAVGTFDTEEFWNVMRDWSKNNLVFISEYSAPEDFKCVWEKQTNLEIRNKKAEREIRIEKLFTIK